MRNLSFALVAGLAGLLGSAGCSDDTNPAAKDLAVTAKEAAVADAAPKDASAVDRGVTPDTATSPDMRLVDYNMPLCNDPAALLDEALKTGTKVFKGLTETTESVPIADVLSNMASYTGTVVRIEGVIVEVCPYAGCYIKLLDQSGQTMNLKVDDGTYDFRLATQAGNYAVGEGLPSPTGDHGPEVVIQNHGAMLGNILCPVPQN